MEDGGCFREETERKEETTGLRFEEGKKDKYPMSMSLDHKRTSIPWNKMSENAWEVVKNATPHDTGVGCALYTEEDKIIVGCNVADAFHTSTIHAEMNALGTMVTIGCKKVLGVLVVVDGQKFVPCGACAEMLLQYGSGDVVVGSQSSRHGSVDICRLKDLVPHSFFMR